MLIGQITDCHVTAPGQFASGALDTVERLRCVVRAIGALKVPPALVLGTGDLVSGGTKAEYATLVSVLRDLRVPFFPVVGNHDSRNELRNAFSVLAGQFDRFGFVEYVVDTEGLRILVLDTVRAGSDAPAFCSERLSWLRAQLKSSPGPVLIAMHHPPFACGVGWVDVGQGQWSLELAEVLTASGRVRGILCGHVHRPLYRMWHGIPVSAAPATAPQVYFDLSGRASPAMSQEPPAFQIHQWDGDTLTTYTLMAGCDKRTDF